MDSAESFSRLHHTLEGVSSPSCKSLVQTRVPSILLFTCRGFNVGRVTHVCVGEQVLLTDRALQIGSPLPGFLGRLWGSVLPPWSPGSSPGFIAPARPRACGKLHSWPWRPRGSMMRGTQSREGVMSPATSLLLRWRQPTPIPAHALDHRVKVRRKCCFHVTKTSPRGCQKELSGSRLQGAVW